MNEYVFMLLFVVVLALVLPYLWFLFWLIETSGSYGIVVLILIVILHLGLLAWHSLYYRKPRTSKSAAPSRNGMLAIILGLLIDFL